MFMVISFLSQVMRIIVRKLRTINTAPYYNLKEQMLFYNKSTGINLSIQ